MAARTIVAGHALIETGDHVKPQTNVGAATIRPSARLLGGNDTKRHATKLRTGEHFYPGRQHSALDTERSALGIVFADEAGLPFDLRVEPWVRRGIVSVAESDRAALLRVR